jgi:hypothetical protein
LEPSLLSTSSAHLAGTNLTGEPLPLSFCLLDLDQTA